MKPKRPYDALWDAAEGRGASFALFWQTRAKIHNALDYAYKPGPPFAPFYPHNLHYAKWHLFCRGAPRGLNRPSP
jgi:hypothetical protein